MEKLRIYNLAYNELLRQREIEENRNENTKKEKGRENRISVIRIENIDKEIKWLHEEIYKLENNII